MLVDHHVWVATAAGGLALYTCRVLGFETTPQPPLLIAAATLLIYQVDDLVDRRAMPSLARGRTRVVFAVCAAAALGLLLAAAPLTVRGLVLLGGLPCLCYGVGWSRGRFRDLPGVKPFFVTAALTAAVVAIPVLWQPAAPVSLTTVAVYVGCLFPLLLCNVTFFDVRDLVVDRRCGVRTLPVRLGLSAARDLCATLSLVVALVAAAAFVCDLLPPAPAGELLAAAILTLFLAWRLPRQSSHLRYAFLVDGIPVLLGVAALC